ncbi:primase alpha helix C-terminal domain-containing protein, partial [Streptomyces chrestomyceticus]
PPPHPNPAPALLRFVRTSPDGQRNARLFWAACRAYESGLGQEMATALTTAALHTGLTEREARATIASAARKSSRAPRSWSGTGMSPLLVV